MKLLDEVSRAGEQHAPAVFDQREADGCGEMALPAARRAEHEDVCAFGEPAIAGGNGYDLSLGDHGNSVEGEAVERLSGWASARCLSILRCTRSANSCSAMAERKRAAGHPSRSACPANCGKSVLIVGSRLPAKLIPLSRRWRSLLDQRITW
jgi:hypothetical protein